MGAEVLSSRAVIGTFYELLEQNVGNTWIDAVSNPVSYTHLTLPTICSV